MNGTNKLKGHTETWLTRFDSHRSLCQSEDNQSIQPSQTELKPFWP